MRGYTLLYTALALVGLAISQGTGPTITTPASITACVPAAFSIAGGTAPYFISVLPGGETGATPLANLPNVNAAGTFTWNVNLAPGTNVTIRVTDSMGLINYASPLVIQQGTTTACLSASASVGQQSGATAPSASVTGTQTSSTSPMTSSPTSTAAAGGGTTSSPTTSPMSTAPASTMAATTTTRSGASTNVIAGSAFALIGAAVLALVA